eukprot:c1697_g1_i1.p1 GENE.c1697_g1_i1~~c1697_g1_i1.p1  ORF type:complete len:527 (+),score=137.30 c1697_g1_i1:130-1710(+)
MSTPEPGTKVVVDGNHNGVISKITGRRVKVDLPDGKSIWRELKDIKVVGADGVVDLTPIQAPETPRHVQHNQSMVFTEIKKINITKDIAAVRVSDFLKPAVTSDKSGPQIDKSVTIKANPMRDVLKDLGGEKKLLKKAEISDRSSPVIDSSTSICSDPHQFVRNELLQGNVFTKLLFKDEKKPQTLPTPRPSNVPTQNPGGYKVLYESPSLDTFELKQTLGIGNFGRVKLVMDKETKVHYALKILNKANILALKELTHVKSEKNLLTSIDHPFVVNLVGSFQDRHNVYLIMEYMSGGELYALHRRIGKFSKEASTFYAAELLLAIEYLHSQGIIYRDFKPENVLIGPDGHLRVADFGSAKRVDAPTHTMCGTPEYQAPEIIQHKGHTRAVDYWSLGIMIFEFFHGTTPFVDDTPFAIYKRIFNYAITEEIDFPADIPDDAKNLIQKLLDPDVDTRLGMRKGGIADIKSHAFFAEIDWDKLKAREVTPPYLFPLKTDDDTSYFSKYVEVDFRSGPLVDKSGEIFKGI